MVVAEPGGEGGRGGAVLASRASHGRAAEQFEDAVAEEDERRVRAVRRGVAREFGRESTPSVRGALDGGRGFHLDVRGDEVSLARARVGGGAEAAGAEGRGADDVGCGGGGGVGGGGVVGGRLAQTARGVVRRDEREHHRAQDRGDGGPSPHAASVRGVSPARGSGERLVRDVAQPRPQTASGASDGRGARRVLRARRRRRQSRVPVSAAARTNHLDGRHHQPTDDAREPRARRC